MSLDKAIDEAQKEVPECLAVGYVDMVSGMLLGVDTVDSHPNEVLDLVAATTGDLFQGKNVTEIENMFKKNRGTDDDVSHYFNEIIVLSKNLIHVFIRSKKNQDQAAVFVTRLSANIGMVLVKSRSATQKLEAAV